MQTRQSARSQRIVNLYKKENGICWICRSRVLPPVNTTHDHPLGPSRDHVKIKKTMEYRLAHALCNRRRGRRTNKITENLSAKLRKDISKQIRSALTVVECLQTSGV